MENGIQKIEAIEDGNIIISMQERLRELINEKAEEKNIWQSENEKQTVEKICSLLINRRNDIYNANSMIIGENSEKARESALVIHEILNNMISSKGGEIKYDLFLKNELDRQEHYDKSYILVTGLNENVSQKELDTLYYLLEKYEKENWKYNLLFCVSEGFAGLAKNYEKMDSRLYHYLLGNNKLILDQKNPQTIFTMVCEEMENENADLTPEFKEELSLYIQAVYSDAKKKNQDFVEDCVERIKQQHNSRLDAGSRYVKEDVPSSDKAEELRKQKGQNSKKIDLSGLLEKSKNKTFCPTPDFSKCMGTEINVLVLALSTFPNNGRICEFQSDDMEEPYCYYYQLEPVPQYLSLILAKENMCLDYIVALCTSATKESSKEEKKKNISKREIKDYNNEELGSLEPAGYFKHAVKNYVKEEKNIELIEIDEDESAGGISNAVEEIRKIVKDNTGKKVNLYMDTHGGYRSSSFALEAIISLIRDEVSLQKIYNVRFENDISKICEDKEFKLFDFVSGINEFTNYGRTNTLVDYYEKDEDIDLIKGMKTISEGLMLCDTYRYMEGLKIVNSFSPVQKNGDNREYFHIVENKIKQEFKELNKPDNYEVILATIKWCAKKGFYQQALTFIEDRMPEFFLNKGLIKIEESEKFAQKPNKDKKKLLKKENISWSCYEDKSNIYFYKLFTEIQNQEKESLEQICYLRLIMDKLKKEPEDFWTENIIQGNEKQKIRKIFLPCYGCNFLDELQCDRAIKDSIKSNINNLKECDEISTYLSDYDNYIMVKAKLLVNMKNEQIDNINIKDIKTLVLSFVHLINIIYGDNELPDKKSLEKQRRIYEKRIIREYCDYDEKITIKKSDCRDDQDIILSERENIYIDFNTNCMDIKPIFNNISTRIKNEEEPNSDLIKLYYQYRYYDRELGKNDYDDTELEDSTLFELSQNAILEPFKGRVINEEGINLDTWAGLKTPYKFIIDGKEDLFLKISINPSKDFIKLLDITLRLQNALKMERNSCNHALESEDRFHTKNVNRLINWFVELCEKLLEYEKEN